MKTEQVNVFYSDILPAGTLVVTVETYQREVGYLVDIIRKLNEHEGAEGWSADLREAVDEILE
jgi:hypothetical protein